MTRRTVLLQTLGTVAAGALAGCGSGAARGVGASSRVDGRPFDAAAFAAARRFVPTPSGRVAYVERGQGDVALFLHGFPLNGFQWRGALERLSAHRRCVAPDFLSMGHTEAAEGVRIGPDAQVEMLVSLMDALSIPAADVVASDSGGAIAQLLLVRHPGRVRTLLLANCDAEIDSPPRAFLPVIALSRAGKFVDRWLAPWLADAALARSAKGIGGMCYEDPAHPTDEAIETYFGPLVRSERRKGELHAYAVALERNPLAGIEPELRRSTVPARIVWGMADDIFSTECADYLARTLGGSRGVRKLDSAKLFWPEERPDVVAEEARRLWGIG